MASRDKLRMVKINRGKSYGWFHKWTTKKDGVEQALIESEDGTVNVYTIKQFKFMSDYEKMDYEHMENKEFLKKIQDEYDQD